jgi:hypothetical protein
MKNFFIFMCCALVALAGCSRIDDLEDKVDNLEGRVDKIEETLKSLNDQISYLSSLVNTIKDGGYISDVTSETKDGINYYTLTLSDGKTVTVHDGANGISGKDGATPVIGVKLDEEDGNYYWTVNGEYTDPKVRVNGQDGANGLTPEIKIISDYWVIKWPGDEYYTTLGYAKGANGEDGDSFFEKVEIGDDEVTFVLAGGKDSFSVSLLGAFRLVCETTTVGVHAGSETSVSYKVKGVKEGEQVVVYVKYASAGWAATIDETEGLVKITVPSDQEEGLVIVEAINNATSQVADQALCFEAGVLTVATSSYQVSDASNVVEVPVSTNMLYEVSVDADWIKYIETRAPHTETLVFQTELNTGSEDRTAVITITGKAGDAITVSVLQRGCPPLKESYNIGEYYERQGVVGIVWYNDENCVKILSLQDKSFLQFATGLTSQSNGFSATDGLGNRNSIVNNSYSDISWFPAHQWCYNLGESWYLPAKEEMAAILNNIETLNAALSEAGGSSLRKGYKYWTSTQSSETVAKATQVWWDYDYEKALSSETEITNASPITRASAYVSRKAPEVNPEPSIVIGTKMTLNGADGVVAYVDETGEHGYVISLAECEPCHWTSKNSYQTASWLPTSETDGKSICSMFSSDYEIISDFPAAKWCVYLGNGGWFLPAQEQLKAIFANFNKVNAGIEAAGGTPMAEYKGYWTMTTYYSDDSGLNARHITYSDGEVIQSSDEVYYGNEYRARAIHLF